jgi:hypothetical protein
MDMVETVDNSGTMTNVGDPGKPFVKKLLVVSISYLTAGLSRKSDKLSSP